jgi:hypothetical protein
MTAVAGSKSREGIGREGNRTKGNDMLRVDQNNCAALIKECQVK